MKKLLLAFVFLLLASGSNVYAVPFLDGNGNGSTVGAYSVVDNSQESDIWSDIFGGYSAGNPDEFTGYYIGTVSNDNNIDDNDMLSLINFYLDMSYSGINFLTSDANPASLSITGQGDTAGTWTLNSSDAENDAVNFYAVKSSDEYALYYVDPAASTGFWTTAHISFLNDNGKGELHEISHLSAATTEAAPVPEPATLFLFGVGLVGLAGVRRKIAH